MWIWVLSSRVKSERGERVRYRVEHEDKIHIHAWTCNILYLQPRSSVTCVDIRVSTTISPGLPFIYLPSVMIGYFELLPSRTTFRFPWEFPIAGFNCISWHYCKNIFGGKNGFKTVQFYWMNSTSLLQSRNKQTRKHNDRVVHSWPNVVCFCSSKNTFTQLHYLKFQNCCWNDNYKNRKQSWVF